MQLRNRLPIPHITINISIRLFGFSRSVVEGRRDPEAYVRYFPGWGLDPAGGRAEGIAEKYRLTISEAASARSDVIPPPQSPGEKEGEWAVRRNKGG